MACKQWLSDYVFKTYGYNVIFDQPNLSTNIQVRDFVTRMIIPELNAYIIIDSNDTKETIDIDIKKIVTAIARNTETCPICFLELKDLDCLICDTCLNSVCVNCVLTQCLHNKGQRICPLCRSIKGDQRPDYERIIKGQTSFFVK